MVLGSCLSLISYVDYECDRNHDIDEIRDILRSLKLEVDIIAEIFDPARFRGKIVNKSLF